MQYIKKFFKILLINILILLFLLISSELVLFTLKYHSDFKYNNIIKKVNNQVPDNFSFYQMYETFLRTYKNIFKNKIEITPNLFRPKAVPLIENKKTPIILMGCSYTYGDKLKNEDSFHSVLSHYTNRIVYNFALGAKSPNEMLYILRHFNIMNKVLQNKKEFEYIIYTYIPEHKQRLFFSLLTSNNPKYKEISNNNTKHLEEIKNPSFLRNTYIGINLAQIIYTKKLTKHPELGWNRFVLYMKEINNEIKKQFYYKDGKTKFVIFVYRDNPIDNWKELEKEDIIVVKARDILPENINNEKYTVEDHFHPNAKVWQVIVPALAKELNL